MPDPLEQPGLVDEAVDHHVIVDPPLAEHLERPAQPTDHGLDLVDHARAPDPEPAQDPVLTADDGLAKAGIDRPAVRGVQVVAGRAARGVGVDAALTVFAVGIHGLSAIRLPGNSRTPMTYCLGPFDRGSGPPYHRS